jgi:hypothetical protein
MWPRGWHEEVFRRDGVPDLIDAAVYTCRTRCHHRQPRRAWPADRVLAAAAGRSRRLVQMPLPVAGYPARRAGGGLIERMMLRRGQLGAGFEQLLRRVAPEPRLARLEAADHRMSGGCRMSRRVLRRRGVAAADMPALRTSAQVEPPPASCLALCAAHPARRDSRVNPRNIRHDRSRLCRTRVLRHHAMPDRSGLAGRPPNRISKRLGGRPAEYALRHRGRCPVRPDAENPVPGLPDVRVTRRGQPGELGQMACQP